MCCHAEALVANKNNQSEPVTFIRHWANPAYHRPYSGRRLSEQTLKCHFQVTGVMCSGRAESNPLSSALLPPGSSGREKSAKLTLLYRRPTRRQCQCAEDTLQPSRGWTPSRRLELSGVPVFSTASGCRQAPFFSAGSLLPGSAGMLRSFLLSTHSSATAKPTVETTAIEATTTAT